MSLFASNTTTAAGSDLVTVPFPYLSKSHVHVYLDDNEEPAYSLTWTSPSVIQLSAAPAVGVEIRVQRITPEAGNLVTFVAGFLNHNDLNLNAEQLLYLIQEDNDTTSRALVGPPDDPSGLVYEIPKERASSYLAFDANKRPVVIPTTVTPPLTFTSPWVTPEQFGAVGNGVDDDLAGLQGAIDAVAIIGDGIVLLGRKTYLISAGLTGATPINFQGVGAGMGPGPNQVSYTAGSVIMAAAAFTTGDMLSIVTEQGVTIEGVRFDAEAPRTSGAAVHISRVNSGANVNYNTRIASCGFVFQWDCIRLTEAEVPTIERNLFETWGRRALWLDVSNTTEGSFGFVHHNNFFGITSEGGVSAAEAAIFGNGGYGFITDNVFIGATYGVNMTLTPFSVTTGTLLIRGNQFEEQVSASIAIGRAPDTGVIFGNVVVSDNEFSNVVTTDLNAHIWIVNDTVGDYIDSITIHDNVMTSFLTNPGAQYILIGAGTNVLIHHNVLNNHEASVAVTAIVVSGLGVSPIQVLDNSTKGFSAGKVYNCQTGTVVRDITSGLLVAELGSTWGEGSMCYVSNGQGGGAGNMVLTAGGTGCLAWRQKAIWATLPILG